MITNVPERGLAAAYGPERQFAAPQRRSRYLESCGHASTSSERSRNDCGTARPSGASKIIVAPAKFGDRAYMATAIILLVSALCGVCGAGIAVAIAMVVWPESKTQAEV
jgi:hypothetical protein